MLVWLQRLRASFLSTWPVQLHKASFSGGPCAGVSAFCHCLKILHNFEQGPWSFVASPATPGLPLTSACSSGPTCYTPLPFLLPLLAHLVPLVTHLSPFYCLLFSQALVKRKDLFFGKRTVVHSLWNIQIQISFIASTFRSHWLKVF